MGIFSKLYNSRINIGPRQSSPGYSDSELSQSVAQTQNMSAEEKALQGSLSSIGGHNTGWLGTIVGDHYPGAWQCNDELKCESLLAHPAVYACTTMISSDIGKMEFQVKRKTQDGIWSKISDAAIERVLKNPNHYQNENEFRVSWILSKIIHGVAYVLIDRDNRGKPKAFHVLDPARVKPGVADDGSIWYNLSLDRLTGIEEDNLQVPAEDIIDDAYAPLYHVKGGIGLGPLYACAVQVANGLRIVRTSSDFFANNSRPGGILTAPGHISDDTAKELREKFSQYRGAKQGGIAVVGDGLKFETMSYSASDSQLVEQLNLSVDMVAMVFRVPLFKLRQTTPPNSAEAMNREYFDSCLGHLIESMGKHLDRAFDIYGTDKGIELDSSFLFRLDSAARNARNKEAIAGGWMTVNEVRALEDLPPVDGGDTVYLQQQNFSIEALNKRDAMANPFDPKAGELVGNDGEAVEVVEDPVRVADILQIATLVASSGLPIDSASAIMAASFPQLSSDQINAILTPLIGFNPPSPEPVTVEPVVVDEPAVIDETQDEPEEPEEDDDMDEVKAFIKSLLVNNMDEENTNEA